MAIFPGLVRLFHNYMDQTSSELHLYYGSFSSLSGSKLPSPLRIQITIMNLTV